MTIAEQAAKIMADIIAAERARCVAILRRRQENQEHLCSDTYTQFSAADRQMFTHAVRMLTAAADEIERGAT